MKIKITTLSHPLRRHIHILLLSGLACASVLAPLSSEAKNYAPSKTSVVQKEIKKENKKELKKYAQKNSRFDNTKNNKKTERTQNKKNSSNITSKTAQIAQPNSKQPLLSLLPEEDKKFNPIASHKATQSSETSVSSTPVSSTSSTLHGALLSSGVSGPNAEKYKLIDWFSAPENASTPATVVLGGIGPDNHRLDNASTKSSKDSQYSLASETTGLKDKTDNKITQSSASQNFESLTHFNYLNLNHIEKHVPQAMSQYDLASVHEQNKKLSQMQKTAMYISDKYDVDLKKSEQIVLQAYKNSNIHQVPPSLVLGVIGVESTFKQQVVSSKSAKGLMQVIPRYHPEEMKIINNKNLTISSIEGGIELGTRVLKKYLEMANGNVAHALQIYNGSQGDKQRTFAKKVLQKKGNFEMVAQK